MEIVFLIIGLFVGSAASFFAMKYKYRSSSSKLEERNTITENSLTETKAELESERAKVIELSSNLSALNTVNSNLEQKLSEQKKELDELQSRFTKEFENLANKILDANSEKFAKQNKESLDVILGPLKEKISEFEKKVGDVYKTESDERNILKGEINKLVEFNRKIGEDAENLTKALKGDIKKLGDWGEDRLEILLQKAGLKKDIHYRKQESYHDDDGVLKRLDIIINLPDNKSIIIDSKVSLVNYTNYFNSENEADKDSFLKKYLENIYSHINELGSKNYHDLYGINSPEYVLMYIPIEPAFYAAVENDKELFLWALEKKNVVIITTTTMLATLSTVSFIWSQENQKRNALEIARQSGALYDKFVGFVEDLENIGKKIESVKETYEDAMKKLSEGSGNLIKRVETIKQLGAKSTKSIPNSLLDKSENDGELFNQ